MNRYTKSLKNSNFCNYLRTAPGGKRRNYIRYLQSIILILFLIPSLASAENRSIGKIIKKKGHIDKTNINCSTDNCKSDDMLIYPGDRILTGKKSETYVILDDGTGLEVLENSDVIIYSIVNRREKTLTNIFSDYGKFKIIQQNDFMDASMVFKTRTAIIKSVCSTMNIISGNSETGIFVYKGEAGFANIDPSIITAYVLKSGYESFVNKNSPPAVPRQVRIEHRSSWLTRLFLTKDRERILKYNKKSGAVDWFFMEKSK